MAFFMQYKNQTVKEYIKGLIIKRIMSDTFIFVGHYFLSYRYVGRS